MNIKLLACLALFFQIGNLGEVFAGSSVVVSVFVSPEEAGWCINYRPVARDAFAGWFKNFAQQYGNKATVEIECYPGAPVADFLTVAAILKMEGFTEIRVCSPLEPYNGRRPRRLDAVRLRIED